jgi:hypothetical protein
MVIKSGLYLGTGAAYVFLTASATLAQTACIRCSGPSELYACQAIADSPISEKTVGLFCAAKIAHDYRHVRCAAQTGAENCPGIKIEYAYEVKPSPEAEKNRDLRWSKPDETVHEQEPETLGEFAAETLDQSAKTIKKAGDNIGDAASKAGKATSETVKNAGQAIGNATKKTLKCLGSALNDC